MFERLATQYYDQDAISDSLVAEVNMCMSRAKNALQENIYNIIKEKNSFHDWYLTAFEICSERHTLLCRLQFTKNELQYNLALKNLVSVHLLIKTVMLKKTTNQYFLYYITH